MYRLSEEVVRKILKNVKSPEMSPMDVMEDNPFMPKNLHSVGWIDPYCCIGTDFDYILEVPYPFINPNLPPLETLDGYWLYRREELQPATDPFSVPRYLADPNISNADEMMDVTDCSIVIPEEWQKLGATSILTFEALIKNEPLILDCLQENLK